MSATIPQAKNPRESIGPTDVPLQSLPVVELSKEQLEQAASLAEGRNRSYHEIDGGVVFGDRNSLQSHEIGILGELAVARFFKSTFDHETYAFGDQGFDIQLWGKTADVKTTATAEMTLPQLLVRADKTLDADLYIRAHIIKCKPEIAKVRLLGYAPRTLVKNREARPHPGETMNLVVEPRELSLLPFVQDCHA